MPILETKPNYMNNTVVKNPERYLEMEKVLEEKIFP